MEDDDAQWRAYYDSCGITKDTQDRILGPKFEEKRRSGSSALEFNMELVYWKLALIRTDSYERAAKLQQAASLSASGSGSQEASGGGTEPPGSGQTNPIDRCLSRVAKTLTRVRLRIQLGGAQNQPKHQ
jgi:hypothetical protein